MLRRLVSPLNSRPTLVPWAFLVISSFDMSDSLVRRIFKIAVGFVIIALVLLAGAVYMSVQYMDQEQQLAATGDVEGALQKTETAAWLNPFDSTPLQVRSNLLIRQGQNEAAAEALVEAIDRDPANYTSRVSLGNLQAARLNQPEEAVKSYKLALKQIPRDTGLISALALALTRVDDLEGARLEYEKLVELEKISPRGLFNLGKIYVRTGDPEKGVETLQEAKRRASASLERTAEESKRAEKEAFLMSVDLALVDAFVVEGRYDEARAALQESGSEQAPAILQLLDMDPEGYRETVLNSEA